MRIKLLVFVTTVCVAGLAFVCGAWIEKNDLLPKHVFQTVLFRTEKLFPQGHKMTAIDQSLIDALGEPVGPIGDDSYRHTTPPELGRMSGLGFKSYEYFPHYRTVVDYLLENKVKQSALLRRREFWDVESETVQEFVDKMKPKRQFLKETIGLQDLPPSGSLKSTALIFEDDAIAISKATFASRIDSIDAPAFVAMPKHKKIKGIILTLHGYSSTPEKVLGLGEQDYTRDFGNKLARQGFIVYAPYLLNAGSYNSNISVLGMLYSQATHYAIDLQKLLSIIDYIEVQDQWVDLPIVVYGISYGGDLSVMLASIDERVDMVVSSCVMQWNRLSYEEYYTENDRLPRSSYVNFNNAYQVYFSHGTYANLIFPRPFVVELGTHSSKVHNGVQEWQEIQSVYQNYDMGQKAQLVWFRGYNQAVPELTVPLIDAFVASRVQSMPHK